MPAAGSQGRLLPGQAFDASRAMGVMPSALGCPAATS
jgi:hypothetical protein